MGVSLSYLAGQSGRRVYLNLGAPSYLYNRLLDEGLTGGLGVTDIAPLRKLARTHEGETAKTLRKLAASLARNKTLTVLADL